MSRRLLRDFAFLAISFAIGCGDRTTERSARDAVVSAPEPDASVRPSAVAIDPHARFEAHDDELRARVASHAVVARDTETRVDGPLGRLITLGISRASRGASTLGVAGRPERDEDGNLRRAMGSAAAEQLVTSPLGTEQSWHLASRPSGRGALTVTVPVTSGRYLGTDARGLRFEDAGGEVLYSHATFIDASGSRTSVPATYVDGAIVLRVDARVLDDAKYPAVLDPTISPVMTITGPAGAGFPAYGDQRGSSVDSIDGGSSLVAYLDLARPDMITLEAQRIDELGAPLGARVRLATGVADAPTAVACDAASCLVVYVQADELRGLRIDPAGTILDAQPRVIAPLGSIVSLTAHDDGAGRLVAWSDRGTPTGTSFTIRARRIDASGQLVGSDALTLGTVLGAARLDSSTLGGSSVVVWDEVVGGAGRIQGIRISQAGALLDPSPITLVDATSDIEMLPSIAPHAGALLLAYYSVNTIWGVPMSNSPTLGVGSRVELTTIGYVAPLDIDLVETGVTTTELAYVEDSGYSNSYTIRRGTIPGTLSTIGTLNAMPGVHAYGSAEMTSMLSGPVIVASVVRYDAAKPMTNGYDVQSLIGATTGTNLSLGAASARAPTANYGPSQFAIGHVVDEAWAGRTANAVRLSPTGTRVDNPGVELGAGTSSLGVTMSYDAVTATSFTSSHAFVWRRQYLSTTSRSANGVNETRTLDTASAPSLGLVRSIASTYFPFAVLSGTTFLSMASVSGGVNWTTVTESSSTSLGWLTNTPSLPNLRGNGQRAVGYTATQLFVLAPSATRPSPTLLSTSTLDDGGLGVDFNASLTLVVRRNGVAGVANAIESVAVANGLGLFTTRIVHSGTGLVSSPRVAYDGTYFNVFYIRDTTLYLIRVNGNGTVYDTTPSVVATGILSGHLRNLAAISDRAGRVLVAWEWFDPTEGVRALRISAQVIDWNGTGSGAPNGTTCSSVLQCASGICVDGVCCDTTCGGGVANDCQACSAAANGTSPNGTCGPASNAITCRSSAGPCDQADTCDGASTSCPADGKVQAGTVCGAASTQPCETAQMCDGVSDTCQAKAPAQGSPLCRASTGPCDVAEVCNGTSTTCPADGFATAAVVCRAADGVCDRAESCTGTSSVCPDDGYLGNETVCRASAGICDRADTCNGLGTTCPADAPAAATVVCRTATRACDVPETCDGTSFVCPADLAADAGTPCRAAVSLCDVEETCNGTGLDCPADAFNASAQLCRASTGPCDLAEYCTGTSSVCPIVDTKAPSGTVCRASAGPCDVAESCDGVASACPVPTYRVRGTVCRSADGICDSAETCSGGSAFCPSDRSRVDGSGCGDGLVCNGAETCLAGECVEGEALVCAADSPCLESTGECVVQTRPGGPPGCSVATAGSTEDPRNRGGIVACVALAVLALALARTRRARLRMVTLGLGALALVAQGCVCGVGAASCDGVCVDVGYDEDHCGACGVSCGSGQCVDGACVGVPTTGNVCDDDSECIDGDVCDGVERCVAGRCRGGSAIDCDDGLDCSDDRCDEALGSCVSIPSTSACGVSP